MPPSKRPIPDQLALQPSKHSRLANDDDSGNMFLLPYCEMCNMNFSKPYALKRHVSTVHGGVRFACDVQDCKETFTRKDTLERHIETQHGFGNTSCRGCGKMVRKDALREHLEAAINSGCWETYHGGGLDLNSDVVGDENPKQVLTGPISPSMESLSDTKVPQGIRKDERASQQQHIWPLAYTHDGPRMLLDECSAPSAEVMDSVATDTPGADEMLSFPFVAPNPYSQSLGNLTDANGYSFQSPRPAPSVPVSTGTSPSLPGDHPQIPSDGYPKSWNRRRRFAFGRHKPLGVFPKWRGCMILAHLRNTLILRYLWRNPRGRPNPAARRVFLPGILSPM